MCLRIKVVGEVFTFEPSQKTPLGRRDMAGGAAGDRVGDCDVFGNVVDRLGAVEGERGIVFCVVVDMFGVGKAFEFEAALIAGVGEKRSG